MIRSPRGFSITLECGRRNTDPSPSHQAAVLIVPHLSKLHRWAASCVRINPGFTARELAEKYCPTDPRKIGRRLIECVKLGMIETGPLRKCRVSGRTVTTWNPKAEELKS